VVTILDWADRRLADAFGYVAPAPGGPFTLAEWTDTEWGPRLGIGVGGGAGHTWAGCELIGADHPATGWGILVRLRLAHVEVAADPSAAADTAGAGPLVHRQGRYFQLP
jgi:hypothetical protein